MYVAVESGAVLDKEDHKDARLQAYVNFFDSMLEWYEEWKRDQVSDDPVAYTEWKFTYPHPINRKKKR